jgi:hypothetical protein
VTPTDLHLRLEPDDALALRDLPRASHFGTDPDGSVCFCAPDDERHEPRRCSHCVEERRLGALLLSLARRALAARAEPRA